MNYIHCKTEENETIVSCGVSIESIDSSINNKNKSSIIFDIDTLKINYYTVVDNKEGSKVHTVKSKYLRTDANKTESDNLDNVPKCKK